MLLHSGRFSEIQGGIDRQIADINETNKLAAEQEKNTHEKHCRHWWQRLVHGCRKKRPES